ncbi:MAG: class I SAM-dependent methyltransferase [Chloroflexi bacterium]|nr:class I SAM-dependent methyltransferase [Chloroflexota bacterium]
MTTPGPESWLRPFLPRFREAGPRVLDAGCGPGLDAAFLAAEGFDVTACDRQCPPSAPWTGPVAYVFADLCALPFRPASFDAVVASLSLHYLPWSATLAAFRDSGELVRPGGCFLFRVNASDDVHHGAGQGEQLEPGFFRVPTAMVSHSQTKRFFTEADVRAVIPTGFRIEHLAHRAIRRYQQPKQVWECLVTRD